MAAVMTVLGPVAPEELGITLAHEHLLLDLSCLWSAPRDPDRAWLVEAQVSPAIHEALRRDPYHCRDNMRLESVAIAAAELGAFAALGGRTVVDLSTRTIGPYPRELAAIARRTGLYIVAGCGFYTRRAHPAWVAGATVEALAESMIADLTIGFAETGGAFTTETLRHREETELPPSSHIWNDDATTRPRSQGVISQAHGGTGEASQAADAPVRAGIIGEIGTSAPIHPNEERVLRAAARAQRATGAAINVHLAIFGREGPRVLDILEDAGADLARVALSHLDESLDHRYHLAIARRGAFVEFDTFGSECAFEEDGLREPTDEERIAALLRLLDAGYERQMLLSQDVCTKMHWTRMGGRGYGHLLRTVVPALRARGVPEATIAAMLTGNPARLLSGEAI